MNSFLHATSTGACPYRPKSDFLLVSRYQTDRDRGFPVKEKTIAVFDFLVVAFLNIGKFFWRHDGATGAKEPEFFTFPQAFIREHHEAMTSWEKVKLRGLDAEIEPFKGEAGFE